MAVSVWEWRELREERMKTNVSGVGCRRAPLLPRAATGPSEAGVLLWLVLVKAGT